MRHLLTLAAIAIALDARPARASFDPFETVGPARLILSVANRSGPSATLLDEGPGRAAWPGARLLGNLDASETERLAGGGERSTPPDPVVALILGIIGFGLGHWYAGDPDFITWTIIDLALLAAQIIFSVAAFDFWWLIWIATVIERVFEGISAYNYAAGRSGAARIGMALPEDRETGPAAVPRFGQGFSMVGFAF